MLEEGELASFFTGCNLIFENLVLSVEVDRAAHEFGEVEAVGLTIEVELDAIVATSINLGAVGDSGLDENVNGRALEDSRLDGALNVIARAAVDDNRVNSCLLEEVGELEACGSGTNNADLSTNGVSHVTIHAQLDMVNNGFFP